jgi:hypothetical protein
MQGLRDAERGQRGGARDPQPERRGARRRSRSRSPSRLPAAPGPREALALYARLGREIAQRTHRLVTMVLAQAATGDAGLKEFAELIEAQHAAGTAAAARHLASRFELRAGVSEQAAADILWTLTAPDITSAVAFLERAGS